MKSLAVLNWAGHGNFGDELFNLAYKELFKGWDIHFFTNSSNVKLPLVDFDFINQNCDLFALGGGELINQGQLFIPSYWTSRVKSEIPKILLGCGVNTSKSSKIQFNVIQELENFAFIGLRDLFSVNLLSEYSQFRGKLGLFYDLAFSNDYSKVQCECGERVAVVIPTDRVTNQYDRGIQKLNLVKKSGKWLKDKVSIFDRVTFLAFGSEDNNDYETCKRLSEVINKPFSIISFNGSNFKEIFEAVAKATTVYSYRLHGLILAKIYSKPYGLYHYHHKLARMEQTLQGTSPELIKCWQREALNNVLRSVNLCS